MNNEECTAWVQKWFHSTDIAATAKAFTDSLDWLLGLEPDVINEHPTMSYFPPNAALGIFLGATAMIHTGQAFRAPYWMEEAINAYYKAYPADLGYYIPSRIVAQRYPALDMVQFYAALANDDWQEACSILEILECTEDRNTSLWPNFTRVALKDVIAADHPLGPYHYDEQWLFTQQEALIAANALDERYVATWTFYTRYLYRLVQKNRIDDAVVFARSKVVLAKHFKITSVKSAHFYIKAIELFSQAGLIDEALSCVMDLVHGDGYGLNTFAISSEPNARSKAEENKLLANLIASAGFKTLQARYLVRDFHDNERYPLTGPFKSIYEKALGGKSRKRCAVSKKLIAPGDPVYIFKVFNNAEHIVGKVAFEASELNEWAIRHNNDDYSWLNFASNSRFGVGVFHHPDLARFMFDRVEGKRFDVAEFIDLIANPLVFPMRFEWVAGKPFGLRQASDKFFVNDDLAGEFVTLCWMALKCGHAKEIFTQLTHVSHPVSDPIYAMLATFERDDCRSAAAEHFGLPELPEMMTLAFSSRLSLDAVLLLADFGQKHPRFAQALAAAMLRYNLHLYSNYHPQVDWFLQGLEHYSVAKCSQLLYFFVHIPEQIPVLAAMLERGVMVNGISERAYDGYGNTGNYFHHTVVMHCMLHAPDKLAHWLESPWMNIYLLGAPLRQTLRHVEAYRKKSTKRIKAK